MSDTALVWYRRDLRVHDLPALHEACAGFARVVPCYVLDPLLLQGRYRSANRIAFMLAALAELDEELRARGGGGLVVREGDPRAEVPRLAAQAGAAAVLWTSDVSPYAVRRDRAVMDALRAQGIEPRPQSGGYMADVSRPRTKDGRPFSVFSPFFRAWEGLPRRAVLPAPAVVPPLPDGLDRGTLPTAQDPLAEPIAVPGERAARARLEAFLGAPLEAYDRRHDDLTGGTSVLSPYLRWGQLSPREIEGRLEPLLAQVPKESWAQTGPGAFRRQLAWRDFYAHVLLSFPGNIRHEFQPRFRERLRWQASDELFAAWAEGRTGYPLVDAGMRQLGRTGWMHNRARLVTGSFLTKDLHMDWRLGEEHFARWLYDGEPAQNNGNWQWIASTGVDPAPYFRRMFNPTTQARKFDPSGAYIREYVPELRGVPDRWIHEPWRMPPEEQESAGCVIGRDYPAPVVDHAAERKVAMERYREAGDELAAEAEAKTPQ
jgi:deoxyribodipyrimidine photo-lyase